MASVILGWVTFRVIAFQGTVLTNPPASVRFAVPASHIGAIVQASALIPKIQVRTSGLLDVTNVPKSIPTHASKIIFEALSNRSVEPISVVQVNNEIVDDHGVNRLTTKPSSPLRLSLYSWAFVRQHSPSTNFVPEGQLGGSQAGLRALYRLGDAPAESQAALSVRVTRPLAINDGAEAGLGLELHPIASLPINVILERRVRLEHGGRNAWSGFVAGGFSRQLPGTNWVAEGYLQAGLVGARQHDGFIDGAIGLAHPFGPDADLQAGVGAWGGIQPDVKRLDIGPRLKGVVHTGVMPIQWEIAARMQVVGQVRPASGLTLTISSGF
ncbi:hypothetical protein [Aquisediminimonas sediminicola]|uniref:hypothetical protein n=1 Tax=Alteraquisediminimonas sediminicola TaxID=2676787 RepID=UPI001C8D0AB0|nr:hypothetical protein [Aquisediminimonas sediminicola]